MMKKIENNNDDYSNFLDDDEIIEKRLTNNDDASANTEAVETSRAKEPEEPEYTIVAENTKMKIALCIGVAAIALIIIILINFGMSRTQKSHNANINDFSTSITEVTEKPLETSSYISNNPSDATEQATKKNTCSIQIIWQVENK